MVLADKSDIMIDHSLALWIFLQASGFLKLYSSQRVLILHHQGTAEIVDGLRVLVVLGDSLAVATTYATTVGLCAYVNHRGYQHNYNYSNSHFSLDYGIIYAFLLFMPSS